MDDTARPSATSSLEHPRRRFRGPFARWPRAADAGLAIAIFAAAVTLVDGPGDAMVVRSIGEVPAPALLVFAVASAALYWRRRAPLVVLGIAVMSWAVLLGSGFADIGGVTIVALYSTGRYATRDVLGEVGALAAVAVIIVDGLTDPAPTWAPTAPFGEAIFGAFVLFGAWYVGRRVRLRHERADQARRQRAAEARRIVVEERARIARELHDVVAHRVSLMTVQAGAAKTVAADDLDAALQAMGAVEEAGRQALDELRHLLGVLRPDLDVDELGPQPGLSDLPRLVEQIRDAGLEVTLTMDDARGPLSAAVELSAYRIVQEALTNVLKHGGAGARAEVVLRRDGEAVTIEVTDDGRPVPPVTGTADRPATGHGIVGMRERALLLGGRLDAGPRRAGGFRVHAQLPTGEEPA